MLKRDELLPYEYWAFDAAATDEMADVLLKMKMRKPYTLEAAAKRPAWMPSRLRSFWTR